jgi:hypothetical protein
MSTHKIQTAIEDAINGSLRQILDHLDMDDVKLVFANQGGLEPPKTYCLMNIIDKTRVGRVQESVGSPVNGISENWYTNYYTLLVQISFIGKDSGDVMAEFEDSVFSSRRCLEYWQLHKLGAMSQSESRRIPQLRDTTWVPAYNIDLNLSFAIQSNEEIDWIESFIVEDTIGFSPTPSP